jgi:calcium-dependent protein kinase
MANARAGKYTFDDNRGWKNVPESGKDFVRKLLRVNPSERMAAREALKHPWLLTLKRRNSDEKLLEGKSISNVIDAMTRFEKLNAMQRTALLIHAHLRQSSSHNYKSETNPLHEVFLAVDKDFSGDITLQEFGDAFKQKFSDPKVISRIFSAIDQDGSGLIHYTEFLAACLFVSPEETIEFEMDVDTVFDKLDTDRDGLISESNLREILGPMCTRSYVSEILGTSNDDSNGKSDEPKIDRKQFKRLIGLVKDACKSVSTPELRDTEEEEKEDSA